MIAFALVFRNVLEPGQRETVKHYLPFMAVFAPHCHLLTAHYPHLKPFKMGFRQMIYCIPILI